MEMNQSNAKVYRRKRRFKYGSHALIFTISIVGLLVIGYVALSIKHWRLDFTANRSFTLSSQTTDILENLKEPIIIRAFFRPGGDFDQVFIRRKVDDVLKEYAAKSHQVDYAMVNPDEDLEQALAYKIQNDGIIVLQSKDNRKDIYQSSLFNYPSLAESSIPLFVGESLFTNALYSITHGGSDQLCFLTGHGERQTTSLEADGLNRVFDLLKSENYLVDTVSLGQGSDWDKRCDILIIAGPKLGFHPQEDQAIFRYLQAGKKIVLMVDPQSVIGLETTLKALGLSFHKGVVFDPEKRFILGPHYPAPVLEDHSITGKIKEQELSPIFYLARPILLDKAFEGPYEVKTILSSSPAAWGETELKVQVKPEPDPKNDLKGPLVLGTAITQKVEGEGSEPLPIALIYGDSNFITNGLIEIPGNKNLFMNSVAWLLNREEQIAIRPQKPDFRPLVIGPEKARIVAVSTQLVYPGLVLAFGLTYWWRRRRA